MHETSAEPPQSEEDVDSEIFYQEVQENGEKFFYKLGYKIRSFMDKIKKYSVHRKIPSEYSQNFECFLAKPKTSCNGGKIFGLSKSA